MKAICKECDCIFEKKKVNQEFCSNKCRWRDIAFRRKWAYRVASKDLPRKRESV